MSAQESGVSNPWTQLAHVRLVPQQHGQSAVERKTQLSEDIKCLERALARARELYNFDITPIYSLADEVLLEIFEFALASACERATLRESMRPIIRWIKATTHVSRRFRRIAVDASSLWTQFRVYNSHYRLDLMHLYFTRSRSRDMSLYSFRAPYLLGNPEFSQHGHRIRSIDIKYGQETTSWSLDNHLRCLPNLSSFIISRIDGDRGTIDCSVTHPSLSTLMLNNCFVVPSARVYANLVELCLMDTFVQLEDFMTVIGAMRLLKELHLDMVYMDYPAANDIILFGIPLPESLELLDVTAVDFSTLVCFILLAPSTKARLTMHCIAPPSECLPRPLDSPIVTFRESYPLILKAWLGHGRGPSICSVASHYNPVALDTHVRFWRKYPDRDTPVPDVEFIMFTDESYRLCELLNGPDYESTTDLYVDVEYDIATPGESDARWEDVQAMMPKLRTLHVTQDTLEDTLPRFWLSHSSGTRLGTGIQVTAWPPALDISSAVQRSGTQSTTSDAAAATYLRYWLRENYEAGYVLEELHIPAKVASIMDALDTVPASADASWRRLIGEVRLF